MALPSSQADARHDTESARVRELVLESLHQQGFTVRDRRLLPPELKAKDEARNLHASAVARARTEARPSLVRKEETLLRFIARGDEVVPERIQPCLVEVKRRSMEEALFYYARLHWSIPTSRGYGRRLRFLVFDEANGKLMGLIGMCDPVYSLQARDSWIGWAPAARQSRLNLVMDLFVLGSVPPYSALLAGKLMSSLAASNEVREIFAKKYGGRRSVISAVDIAGDLALLTTVSALGRSSQYNRLTFEGHPLFLAVGATKGTGEIQFSNGVYETMREHALKWCTPSARHARWGDGFRNRREVVKKCLTDVGLSSDWVTHGIHREIFVVPTATNTRRVLLGLDETLDYVDRPTDRLIDWYRRRWLLPRAARDATFSTFDPDTYRLWTAR